MTKKELIEKLEKLKIPDDATIYIYEVGDLDNIVYHKDYNEVGINDR